MSATKLSTSTLDQILALQFLVAWAGEGLCDPPRLGWWRTDMVDELGGGDFLKRLAPRTWRWAALESARRAALLADRKARGRMPDPDAVRTLFFWGFDLDEALGERLRDLKATEREADDGRIEYLDPAIELPFPPGTRPSAAFDRAAFEAQLKALAPLASFQNLPNGREVKTPIPDDPAEAARALAASLVPLTDAWNPPYYRRPADPPAWWHERSSGAQARP